MSPLCHASFFKRGFLNRIIRSNVRLIINYSSFISNLMHPMFEKINTSFVSSDCFSLFSHVCVVIAFYRDHIFQGWWRRLRCILLSLSRVYIYYLYSSDIITYTLFPMYILLCYHICSRTVINIVGSTLNRTMV